MIVAREQVESYSLPGEITQPRRRRRRAEGLPRGQRLAATGLVLLFFATGILVAFYCAQVAATGYRIHKVENDLAMLRKETHGLHGEITSLSSLDRVEVVAVSRLGMVKPEANQVVMVETDFATANTIIATTSLGLGAGRVEEAAPQAADRKSVV